MNLNAGWEKGNVEDKSALQNSAFLSYIYVKQCIYLPRHILVKIFFSSYFSLSHLSTPIASLSCSFGNFRKDYCFPQVLIGDRIVYIS